jgi:hypothetical protein
MYDVKVVYILEIKEWIYEKEVWNQQKEEKISVHYVET